MSDKILVHRLGADPIELPRSQCHLFSRSQMLLGQTCPQKREWAYHWQGRGVESTRLSEDLALGTAVHAGLELLLSSYLPSVKDETVEGVNIIDMAADLARTSMLESFVEGMEMQIAAVPFDPQSEVAQLLAEEQANLAYGLVWTFGRRRLASLLERFEVMEVEPEICWLVGSVGGYGDWPYDSMDDPAATHIVMMSRPDAILRSRIGGKLYTVSWKTAKRFDSASVERLECDVQGLTEGLAVWAKYGEMPAGTLYSYFLKGDRQFDAETGAKRYTSPLVRPYSNWSGIGEPSYRAAHKWFNEAGEEKRCGKGWERVDIWKGMEMEQWLELLNSGEIQPEAHRDWLAEAVIEPDVQPFNPTFAERWRQKAVQQESDWISILAGGRIVPQDETGCHVYNRKCTYYNICWRGETIEDQIAAGYKRLRQESNHPAEFGGEDDE